MGEKREERERERAKAREKTEKKSYDLVNSVKWLLL